ncbi:isopeptide-forming domain-containing fimbrial protein [Bifidobacterium sp. 82T10]|uniref:Isopeptide-forming domain-containing fimbrial protein n=1 Tax=Bifidobacterium miconis TaxID=2834435 RepID=A0ABS6WEN5_9BIFI|nr:isopeptide-forming domain-containing fimbrial protein [Bifidobacterium miconis]MBW3092506.1 isopeptide-forming domain-containing fimbrial protein [Bifidobacterium miconis]
MKSLIKKLAAVLIAVATTLGLAGLGALTATADDAVVTTNGTITVNTVQGFATNDQGNPKPLTYYTMFTADVTAQNGATNASVTYTLTDEWKSFFTSTDDTAAGTKFTETDTDDSKALSQKAVEYIQGLSDTALADFARKATTWAEANITGDAVKTVIPTKDSKTVDITGLDYGYYLIAPDKAQVTVDGTYNPLLVDLTDITNHVSIQLKHEFPTIDKTVDSKPAEDKNVGDTVSYTLKSTVASNMADYTEGYIFTFHDTLSKGLDLVQPNGVFTPTVTIIGAGANDAEGKPTDVVLKNTDFKVRVKENKDDKNVKTSTEITVELTDLKNKHPEAAGKEITVTYSAKINANATTGTAGNANSAQIEYSNDPSSNQTGTSVPTEVKVHTFEFTIDKYKFTSDNVYNESSERLGGAKFKVYKSDDKPTITGANAATALQFTVTPGSGSKAVTAKYDKTVTTGTQAELVTPAYGRIVVSGLESGTYWLEETEAPQGYNKLTDLIKVVISATYDTANGKIDGALAANGKTYTGKLVSWSVDRYMADENGNYKTDATGTSTGEHPVVPVANKNGLTLPSTGGWGTMLFTVIGVLVVAFGTVWYVKSGRKDSGK